MEGSDQEDAEVTVDGGRWKPRPSVTLRRSKFKVPGLGFRFQSYWAVEYHALILFHKGTIMK